MDSYIVTIYRRDEKNPHRVVGLVESVELEEKRAFRDRDELWGILAKPKNRLTGKKRKVSTRSQNKRTDLKKSD